MEKAKQKLYLRFLQRLNVMSFTLIRYKIKAF